jgi:uncharacterized cupin superfamily protein
MHKYRLSSAQIAAMAEESRVHQFNDKALRLTRTLSGAVGLHRIGIHLVRLKSGMESTQFHYHDADEEFLYILSGAGIADIGDSQFAVSAGDFMGFPAPSPAHLLTNTHDEDLVYLMGGERNAADVVHYPRIARSMIKSHGIRHWVDWDHLHRI